MTTELLGRWRRVDQTNLLPPIVQLLYFFWGFFFFLNFMDFKARVIEQFHYVGTAGENLLGFSANLAVLFMFLAQQSCCEQAGQECPRMWPR